jgi:hypothetical protein
MDSDLHRGRTTPHLRTEPLVNLCSDQKHGRSLPHNFHQDSLEIDHLVSIPIREIGDAIITHDIMYDLLCLALDFGIADHGEDEAPYRGEGLERIRVFY